MSDQYTIIIIHHNPVDLNSELKVVGENNQYINQVHIKNTVMQMSIKYGELIKQFKFKNKVYAKVRYEKHTEDEPTEVTNHHIGIDIFDNLTKKQLTDLDISTDLDNEIQKREMEGSGWNLRGIKYLKKYFHKTKSSNGMTNVQCPIRTNSILNFQNVDTYCFLWSILASIHPFDKDPQRVSKYTPYREELNINNIDFTNGMRIVDIPSFETFNFTLAINVFEYSTEEDNDYNLVPLYISNHNQNRRIIDLILYKNLYILLKKLHVFSGKHDNCYICRNCLNNCSIQSELTIHKKNVVLKTNLYTYHVKKLTLNGLNIIRKCLHIRLLLLISKLEMNL